MTEAVEAPPTKTVFLALGYKIKILVDSALLFGPTKPWVPDVEELELA